MTTTEKALTGALTLAGGETKAVATKAPSPWDELMQGEDLASDGSENERIVWPKIAITTGVSKTPDAGKHGGDFWLSDRQEYVSALEIIPLRMVQQNTFFAADREAPMCMSIDGVAPRLGQPLWDMEKVTLRGNREVAITHEQPSTCATCEFSRFHDNERPLCSSSTLIFVQRVDDGAFAQLRLPVSSRRAWTNALNAYLVHKTKRMPMYAGVFTLVTEEKSEGSKKWYQMKVADFRPQNPEEIRQFSTMLRSMEAEMAQAQQASAETAEEPIDVTPASNWNDVPDRAVNDEDLPL